jgi:hypothetical protein
MMRGLKIFWMLLCVALLQACATTAGPLLDKDFMGMVQKAMPAQDGEVRIAHHASWYPDVKGWNDVRQNSLNILFFGDLPKSVEGVLAASEHSLIMLQWDERLARYDAVKRFAFADLSDAFIEPSAGLRRIVLRSKDLSYQSFFIHSSTQSSDLIDQVLVLAKSKIRAPS